MRSYYKILDDESLYFITSTIVKWVPIFKHEKYIKILIDAIRYNQQNKNLKIFAYVIMPDHFHLIAHNKNLTHIIQSIKSYSAKRIIEELKRDGNLIY